MSSEEEKSGQAVEREEIVVEAKAPAKAKSAEIPDVFDAIRVLGIDDLADKRVVAILIQYLKEKLDRIRVLEADAINLRGEKEALAIQAARQEEQLGVVRRAQTRWAAVGVAGGVIGASAFLFSANQPIFWILLLSGAALSYMGATGSRN